MAYKIKVKSHIRKRNRTYRVKSYTRKRAEKPAGFITVEGKRIPKKETTGYIHYQIRPKAKGITRVLDIGEPKRHQLIRVKTRKGWVTRSVRVQKGVKVSPSETRQIISKAIKYQG